MYSAFFSEKDSVGGASHEISKYHTKKSKNRMSVAMGLGVYGVRGVWGQGHKGSGAYGVRGVWG